MRWPCLLTAILAACSPVPGVVDADGDGSPAGVDCDDTRADVHPGATERCDDGATDEDCDGRVDADDPDVADRELLHADADADGYGASAATSTCPGAGWTTDASDCDDADPAIHPGAGEQCDVAGVDEDCDALVNGADPDATGPLTWYTDGDADGWGGDAQVEACDRPAGTSATTGDCDDADPERNPGAAEACNLLDDDCDGTTDEGVTTRVWVDADLDGYGDPEGETVGCVLDGFAEVATDCDDGDPTVNPGALEVCADGVDQDCDGEAGVCDLAGERSLADADAELLGVLDASRVGTALAGVGDLDGDGFGEWAAGIPGSSRNAAEGGLVAVFGAGTTGTLDEDLASFRIGTDTSGAELGAAVVGLGDVDGDGFDDLAVGAPGASQRAVRGGAAALFLGPFGADRLLEEADAAWYGAEALGRVGEHLADGQDLDHDGLPDLLLAAPLEDADGTNRGRLYLVPGLDLGELEAADRALATISGTTDAGSFAHAFTVTDLDGDGVSDLVLGLPSEASGAGAIAVLAGPLSGSITAEDADHQVTGADPGSAFGTTVVATGDLDGDGTADLAVGAPLEDAVDFESGAVHLLLGPVDMDDSSAADATITGAASWEHLGSTLTVLGDLDGDGVPDLGLTAGEWPDGTGTGKVYGMSGAVRGTLSVEDHLLGVPGPRSGAGFGATVARAGDVDGDGTEDLLVGNPQADDAGVDGGGAWLFLDRGY